MQSNESSWKFLRAVVLEEGRQARPGGKDCNSLMDASQVAPEYM